MTFQFDANISFMFKELPCLLERYIAASEAGFKGVECGDEIYQYTTEQLVEVKDNAKVKQVLILGYGGAKNALTAIPGKEEEFKKCLAISLKYALALDCKKIHIASGVINTNGGNQTKELYEETYIKNLRYCASEAQKAGVTILIEPITTIPGYFLTDTRQVGRKDVNSRLSMGNKRSVTVTAKKSMGIKPVEILKKLDCDNVKLEFDFFHAQRSHGNLTRTLKDYLPHIGHIQVSQVPERGEPNSFGEINYSYIFELLQELGYNKWVGCEYTPSGKTEDGLTWVKYYGLEL